MTKFDDPWSSLFEIVNAYYFDFLRPSTRYGQQNDKREQNRALTSTNEDLQRQLEEMKVITLIIESSVLLSNCFMVYSDILKQL